ncbi:MAG TPA: TerC/Alx family metal homeostasis membrane protein [Elusimicrobiales bacterium]|nr:TerC/Alx family metal homeostasis membrane protein [Elusimicrobiales bacterium]
MDNLTIMWLVFAVTASSLFIADIKLSAGRAHEIGTRESLKLVAFWITVALLFGLLTGHMLGRERMVEFFTGYVIEYSLSMDNMFVFLIIFNYFAVPKRYQPKILTWGILGAVLMRLVLIFVGVGLINAFHWIIYVFGLILIVTAVKLIMQKDEQLDPGRNPVLHFLEKFIPFDKDLNHGNFFVKKEVWHATPLFATLVVVETTDLIFAVDSIPAILAISREPFIVYTSNVFAVVGLRSLYFLLASIMDYFRFLKVGISVVLFYVGVKMMLSGVYHIPALFSLGVVLGILGLSILFSLLLPPPPAPKPLPSKK